MVFLLSATEEWILCCNFSNVQLVFSQTNNTVVSSFVVFALLTLLLCFKRRNGITRFGFNKCIRFKVAIRGLVLRCRALHRLLSCRLPRYDRLPLRPSVFFPSALSLSSRSPPLRLPLSGEPLPRLQWSWTNQRSSNSTISPASR